MVMVFNNSYHSVFVAKLSGSVADNIFPHSKEGAPQSGSEDGHFEFEAVFSNALTIRRRVVSTEGGSEFGNCPCAGMRVYNSGTATMYWGTVATPPYINKDYAGDVRGEPIFPGVWTPIPLKDLNLVRIVGRDNDEVFITLFVNTGTVPDLDTSSPPELTPPTVVSTIPASAATGVQVNESITIMFSEAMDSAFFNSSSVLLSPSFAADISLDAADPTKGIIEPTTALAFATVYTITIKEILIKDLAGDIMTADHVFSFTTAAAPDLTAPTVVSRTPTNASTGIVIDVNGTITFSEAMDVATITTTTCRIVRQSDSSVVAAAVTLSADKKTVTIDPTASLVSSVVYILRAVGGASGCKDLAGNALAPQVILHLLQLLLM